MKHHLDIIKVTSTYAVVWYWVNGIREAKIILNNPNNPLWVEVNK